MLLKISTRFIQNFLKPHQKIPRKFLNINSNFQEFFVNFSENYSEILLKSIPIFNMFHVFALTYYILLRCVTREYSIMSVTTKNYSIYATRKYTTTNDEKYSIYATCEYTTIFDLHDAYYSLLERYMKHVFVVGLVTGDFFIFKFSLDFPLEGITASVSSFKGAVSEQLGLWCKMSLFSFMLQHLFPQVICF